MLYVDLAEIPRVFGGRVLWSASRPALIRFKRSDYVGPSDVPLETAIRSLVERVTGLRPTGSVGLLTQPRYAGVSFNPLRLYFCWDPAGEDVEALVAEVTSTPWGERWQYVLRCDRPSGEAGDGSQVAGSFDKMMHVSPFMPMDVEYHWRLDGPTDRLSFTLDCMRQGERIFEATLSLHRRQLTEAAMRAMLRPVGPSSLETLRAIYWQAFRLWLKRTTYHPRPGRVQLSRRVHTSR